MLLEMLGKQYGHFVTFHFDLNLSMKIPLIASKEEQEEENISLLTTHNILLATVKFNISEYFHFYNNEKCTAELRNKITLYCQVIHCRVLDTFNSGQTKKTKF